MYNLNTLRDSLNTLRDSFISFVIILIFITSSWPRMFVIGFTELCLSRGFVARNTAFNKLRSTSILNSVSKAKVSVRGLGFPLQRATQNSRHRKIGFISFICKYNAVLKTEQLPL